MGGTHQPRHAAPDLDEATAVMHRVPAAPRERSSRRRRAARLLAAVAALVAAAVATALAAALTHPVPLPGPPPRPGFSDTGEGAAPARQRIVPAATGTTPAPSLRRDPTGRASPTPEWVHTRPSHPAHPSHSRRAHRW